MQIAVYTIYDQKSGVYNKPFYLVNDAVAKRSAVTLLRDETTEIARHPEDFTLMKLGYFEDTNAKFELLEVPEVLCKFIELQSLIENGA